MKKIVKSGMRDCTINLDGECAVKFGSPYRVFSVQNNSDNDVVISIYEGKTAEDDGVRVIKAGESGMLAHMKADKDTVYVTGSGNVAIAAGNEAVNPFSKGGKGGESWVNATGNPVTLTGLQGGVPFNSVEVSGKNLIPFPYIPHSSVLGGVTFDVQDDGSIKLSGTATAAVYYNIMQKPMAGVTYTLSGCPDGGGNGKHRLVCAERTANGNIHYKYDDGSGLTFEFPNDPSIEMLLFISIPKDYNADGLVFRPQLENGGEKTSFEPPITCREMALTVSGKNHVPNTYKSTTIGDMTFTINADGSIHAVGTAPTGGANYRITTNSPLAAYGLKIGDTVFCSAGNGMTAEGELHFKFRIADVTFVKDCNSKREFAPYTIADNVVSMDITLWFPAGGTYDSVYYPQIEIGDKYTGYEPPKGITSYTITPDTNPYTVPMDITQVDGTNVISADNDAVISVNANRKNPQLAKVYDIAKRHLLFDGVTDADSPAVVDLSPYELVEETSYMTSASGNTHVTNFMMAVDDFVSHDRIITAMQSSGFETRISSVGKVCNVYVLSSGGTKMTNTKIYGIK